MIATYSHPKNDLEPIIEPCKIEKPMIEGDSSGEGGSTKYQADEILL
jgi:hypothetical protein